MISDKKNSAATVKPSTRSSWNVSISERSYHSQVKSNEKLSESNLHIGFRGCGEGSVITFHHLLLKQMWLKSGVFIFLDLFELRLYFRRFFQDFLGKSETSRLREVVGKHFRKDSSGVRGRFYLVFNGIIGVNGVRYKSKCFVNEFSESVELTENFSAGNNSVLV
ncbi:hypothetical protein Gasu2_34180 [Galdieria sulphuraria]|nr:hypothetical protein Gasu2_34180 [Galdieria sulphuraria]